MYKGITLSVTVQCSHEMSPMQILLYDVQSYHRRCVHMYVVFSGPSNLRYLQNTCSCIRRLDVGMPGSVSQSEEQSCSVYFSFLAVGGEHQTWGSTSVRRVVA